MTPLTPLRAPRHLPLLSLLCLLPALPACGKGQGQWAFELWTPEATRAAPTLLEDGCTLTWSSVDVVIGAGYIDIPDDRVVEVGGPGAWDLLYERVNTIGETEVTASDEATVGFDLLVTDEVEEGNSRSTQESLMLSKGWSAAVSGELQCAAGRATFTWGFGLDGRLACGGLALEDGASEVTRVLFEPERLFGSSTDEAESVLQGEALFAADIDGSGTLVQSELDLVTLAELGYPASEGLLTLGELVSAQSGSMARVEGGARCSLRD